MSNPMDAYIDNRIKTIDDLLTTLVDLHECTGSPEDGCETCFEIAMHAADLHRVGRFIKNAYEKRNT